MEKTKGKPTWYKALSVAMALVLALGLTPMPRQAYADVAAGSADALTTQAESGELADGTYNANGLSTAVLSMYHFHDAQVVVKGDNAWLITTEDTDNTVKRFDGMAYGPQSEILDASDEANRTLVAGTPTAAVVPVYGEDGETLVTRTFVLPVPKSVIAAGADIYYMIKYVEGYSDAHDGDWYKATAGDYYLTGYTLEKVSDDTTLPGEETPQGIELSITNTTNMFKAVSASAVQNDDGSAVLTVALSSSGYKWLYKGTYEEALADNDAIAAGIAAGEGSGNLIGSTTNSDGKLEFKIPVAAGELGSVVPVVAISQSYYDKYVNGQNALERSYFPRQLALNLEEATLVTGDYDVTADFALTSSMADFQAATPVSVHVVGGPNSNNYSISFELAMQNEYYDSVTYPTVSDGEITTATAALTDGAFAISMTNAPNKTAFADKTPIEMTFHAAESAPYIEAGTDVVRTVTINNVEKTIEIGGDALKFTGDASDFAAGQYVVSVSSIKTANSDAYNMFVPSYEGTAGIALVTVAENGTATMSYYNSRNTYSAIYLGEVESGSTVGCLNQKPTTEQIGSGYYVLATVNESNSSYRDYLHKFDSAWLGETVPYVTVSRTSGKFNSAQLALKFGDSLQPLAAYEVDQLIAALPEAADVTILDKDAIEAARAAYDALSDENKTAVSNYNKLVAAEEAFANLPAIVPQRNL